MRALDVVSEDLQLRLGVDLCILRQEQRLVRLLRVGLLGIGAHDNLAVEDRAGVIREDPLVDLATAAVRLRVIDDGVVVDEPLPVAEIQPVQRAVDTFAATWTNAPSPNNAVFSAVNGCRSNGATRVRNGSTSLASVASLDARLSIRTPRGNGRTLDKSAA